MSEKMDWRDKLKQMMDKVADGSYDDLDESEPEVIMIPREDEDLVFTFLSELGFGLPGLDAIDLQIEELMGAGKFVVFEDVERIH